MTPKSVFSLVVLLLILAPAAFAESPGADVLDFPDVLVHEASFSPVTPATPGCEEEPLLSPAGKGSVVYTAGGCSATANCRNASTPSVSCSTSGSSGTCSFHDATCAPDTRGWVECNGVKTWCPMPNCPTDCSSFNRPGCSYFWNGVLGCCDVKVSPGAFCLTAC